MHFMQRERKRNLDTVTRWVKEERNEDEILRMCQLVLGTSEKTAKEYLKVVIGEE